MLKQDAIVKAVEILNNPDRHMFYEKHATIREVDEHDLRIVEHMSHGLGKMITETVLGERQAFVKDGQPYQNSPEKITYRTELFVVSSDELRFLRNLMSYMLEREYKADELV